MAVSFIGIAVSEDRRWSTLNFEYFDSENFRNAVATPVEN